MNQWCSFCEKMAYTSKLQDDGTLEYYCSEHATKIWKDWE